MAQRYECKLSPEVLEKAVKELNEPEENDLRLAAIDKLRTRFEEASPVGMELIRNDDSFLLRFLRVRKFDQERAYETLLHYHAQRKEWREVFDCVDDPKTVEHLFRAGTFATLRTGRAKDGTFVLIGRPGLGFTAETTMMQFVALIILTVEKLLENEEAQIYGFTIIEDMTNFGISYAFQIVSNARRFFHVLSDCLPGRMKSVNLVNEALVFDVIHTVIGQFMKDKMKDRLALHGSNFKTLHEKIDPAYLPFFLGGSGPDLPTDWWAGEILCAEGEGEETAL